ncbi:MAG: hypothetical protein D3910_22690 [Candidatus Electrothrix sp. ATG2]|nr:hypothetical protein [Candidatus Electrothrix sp. ATG2]
MDRAGGLCYEILPCRFDDKFEFLSFPDENGTINNFLSPPWGEAIKYERYLGDSKELPPQYFHINPDLFPLGWGNK